MKTTAIWVAASLWAGCGLGAGLQESSQASQGTNLNAGTAGDDGGVAKANGGGVVECPQPSAPGVGCEVEASAVKTCTLTGAACAAELAAFDACLALAPPPPVDPCEAPNLALKQCVTRTPNGSCDAELDAANGCLKLNAPPPGCQPKPPPCGGGVKPEDPCLPILDLFKECTLKALGTTCDPILESFDSCEAGSPPPPAPSKP